jgi:ribosomal protein S18 acetylase RimI-like enzyme
MKISENIRSKIKVLVAVVFVLIGIYIITCVRDWKNIAKPVWLDRVEKITENQKSGKFNTKDKYGTPLVLEWEKIEASSPVLSEKMKKLCEIFVQAHTPVVLKFLQKHPEASSTVDEFRPFEQLFKGGVESIDWNFVEEKLAEGLRKNFISRSYSSYGKKDILWFVTVKEKSWNGPVGYALFLLTPQYEDGVIKVCNLMLLPISQRRGIGKLLMSSIFKILPDVGVRRIVLRTLKTNEPAIAAYETYGFKEYKDLANKIISGSFDSYKVNFEYQADKCNLLQQEAKKLE